jgi:hypothetical protein
LYSPEVIELLLAKLKEAGLAPEERAVLERVMKEYLKAVELLKKPDMTLAELRAQLGGKRKGG